jgi:signal transduction histidine kinase
MNLKSIRWRLPLTYAGIALITALVLGGTLLVILRSYYQGQELNYLRKNATAIGGAVSPFLVKDASGVYPVGDLKDHLALVAFLSQTRVRLLDPQGKVLVDFDFSGTQNPKAVLSAISLPGPSGADSPDAFYYLQSSRLGPVNEVGVPPKGEEGTLGIQIFHQDQTQGPTVVKKQGLGLSAQIKIVRIPDTAPAAGSSAGPGSAPVPKGLLSVIPAVGTMYGFDLQGDAQASTVRSNQIYRQAVNAADGTLLGSVELSEGPSVGGNIVMGVARGWIVSGMIGIFIAGLVGWWISRRMSAPLLELSEVTTRMARGDLSARAATGSQDEFGLLASSYNEMADRMEETVRALRRFASDAAHELHTPLTALHTNLELAAADQARLGSVNPALEQAWEQMKRLEALTRDLLDLSRIEAHSPAPCEQVDLGMLVGQACEPFASAAEQYGIEFYLDLPEEEVMLSGQPAQLMRAFENLLNNAVKFTGPEGTIRVKVRKEGQEMVVSVEDNGIGIPAEDLPFVFGRFHRARNATGYPGSGLGLAITKAIIEQHNGSIRVSSGDEGTRFEVRL